MYIVCVHIYIYIYIYTAVPGTALFGIFPRPFCRQEDEPPTCRSNISNSSSSSNNNRSNSSNSSNGNSNSNSNSRIVIGGAG